MKLDVQKQDDGSFRVVAMSTQGKVRRVVGTIHRLDDAAALFGWKERNDGLQRQLDSARARLVSLADALGMTGRDIQEASDGRH